MRNFNVKGLTREALEETYRITLERKLLFETRLERIQKELAVSICAIEDNRITNLAQVKKGLENLFHYCDLTIKPQDEVKEGEDVQEVGELARKYKLKGEKEKLNPAKG